MFGLTPEKLMLVGILAAIVIGPQRLPLYAAKFARFIRAVKQFSEAGLGRMKAEMGDDFDEIDWKKLDPRQYDPRRIIRETLLEDTKVEDPEPVPVIRPARIAADSSQPGANSFAAPPEPQ